MIMTVLDHVCTGHQSVIIARSMPCDVVAFDVCSGCRRVPRPTGSSLGPRLIGTNSPQNVSEHYPQDSPSHLFLLLGTLFCSAKQSDISSLNPLALSLASSHSLTQSQNGYTKTRVDCVAFDGRKDGCGSYVSSFPPDLFKPKH
jgi:hypothetical protein